MKVGEVAACERERLSPPTEILVLFLHVRENQSVGLFEAYLLCFHHFTCSIFSQNYISKSNSDHNRLMKSKKRKRKRPGLLLIISFLGENICVVRNTYIT